MSCLKKTLLKSVIAAALFSAQFSTYAAGMVPETSLLVIDEATHSGTINVKNTDSFPALLYTNVLDLPDDQGLKLISTQPVVRLEPGQTQQLRFILQNKEPLEAEHYKRCLLYTSDAADVLIRPAKLAVVTDAWKYLEWNATGTTLTVKNPSKYVVRLAQNVMTQPSGTAGTLPKTYILPGQSMTATLKKTVSGDNKVKFFPASRYGVEVPSFVSELNK